MLTLEWVDPPFYGGHWVPEQVAQAGGKDVLGHAGRDSGRTSWEDVVQLDPDVIVVMCCGYGLSDNAEFARQVLSHPELRAVRMQLELLKPEMIQQEQGITSTVVMFGSARIPAPDEAAAQVAAAEQTGDEGALRAGGGRIHSGELPRAHDLGQVRE